MAKRRGRRYVRRARSYARRAYGRVKRSKLGFLSSGIAVLTGIEQMTNQDRLAVGFDAFDATTKIKYLVNCIAVRVTGFQPFTGTGNPTVPATLKGPVINPLGMLNKWTGIGIASRFLTQVPWIPYKKYINAFGRGALAGGLIGGFFDPPQLQSPSYNPSLSGTPTLVNDLPAGARSSMY